MPPIMTSGENPRGSAPYTKPPTSEARAMSPMTMPVHRVAESALRTATTLSSAAVRTKVAASVTPSSAMSAGVSHCRRGTAASTT